LIALNSETVSQLLTGERVLPGIARRYRNVLVTQHQLARGTTWNWAPQRAGGDETAALLIASMRTELGPAEQAPDEPSPGSLVFLHPHRAVSVRAAEAGTVTCVWVPWSALHEIETGMRASPPARIRASTLGRGLGALVSSLLSEPSEPGPYAGYLAERLIVEMVFGVLLEAAVPRAGRPGRDSPPIDRARALLLAQRGDPQFNVAVLAEDMHISVRSLHRIFAAESSTPADELRRARVDLACELITDVTHAPLGIEEIAKYSGFQDAAGLRRALAWAGLPSPRVLRGRGDSPTS
jgi:AraC-like DNA-binding protein